ncbi:MAG: hypothetical protein HFE90_08480 [Firmicutes bacterium]|nr:hypothetical protein [Bacillota bacterium]
MKKIFEAVAADNKLRQLILRCLSFLLIAIISVLFLNIMLNDRDGRKSVVSLEGSNSYSDQSKTNEEVRLENILACMSGVGRVEVMIKSAGEEESKSVFSQESGSASSKIDGVIVVAEGAKNAAVKSRIVDAVATVCGIGASDVIVFEMKENGNAGYSDSEAKNHEG